jgi:predicted tellurium resistance membrane protein TerC
METILSTEGILNLFTLTGLEIILGIDNVIFIALLVHTLPARERFKARVIGLSLALILRVLMLFGAAWIIKLTAPLFTLFGFDFAGRNLLLILGGLFLIGKSALEVLELFQEVPIDPEAQDQPSKYWQVIMQITFIDLILSFDSIITAVGMTSNLYVIITAIFIAIIVMLFSAKPIGDFIYKYPSVKVIALAFIAMVGVMLVSNGFNFEFPKGYLYMTMVFSMFVETINILLAKKKESS